MIHFKKQLKCKHIYLFTWSYKMYNPNTHENQDLGIRLQVWKINELHMEISTWNPSSNMPKGLDTRELQRLQTWKPKYENPHTRPKRMKHIAQILTWRKERRA